MSKRLVGTYVSIDEAMMAVERLRDQGYGRNDIHVIADRSVRESIPFTMDAEVSATDEARKGEMEDDRSLWEKIKDAFTFNEYTDEAYQDPTGDNPNNPLEEYRNDLAAGKVVVLVDEDEATHIPPTEPLMGADDMRRDTTPDLTTNDMQSDPPLENDDFMDRDPRNLP